MGVMGAKIAFKLIWLSYLNAAYSELLKGFSSHHFICISMREWAVPVCLASFLYFNHQRNSESVFLVFICRPG